MHVCISLNYDSLDWYSQNLFQMWHQRNSLLVRPDVEIKSFDMHIH